MAKINEEELMKKIITFGRKAHLGKNPREQRMSHRPEGYHGPTDGCFHPGRPSHKPPLSREHILILLSKYPNGVRQKIISQQAGINQSSTSELIDKLEATGYVTRQPDPDDKRATLLFLTEKGLARAAEVEDDRKDMIKDLFAPLTAEEKRTLSDLLDKLLN